MSIQQTKSQLVADYGEGPCSTALWPPRGLVDCSEPHHLEMHHNPPGCSVMMLATEEVTAG